MHAHRLRPIRAAVTLWLVIVVSACASPAPPAATPTATLAIPPTEAIPSPTPIIVTATPPQADAADPTGETSGTTGPDISFNGVRLSLPAELGTAIRAQVSPAIDRLGEAYPAYTEFTLVGYPPRSTAFEPQVQVYPVGELGETGTQIAQELRDILAEKTSSLPGSLPILPNMHAGQLVHAQGKYLSFRGGSGVRLLTQFAQNSWPVNNADLVYVFQGLSQDNAYYISAFLPVSASFLPDAVDDPASVPAVDGVSFPDFNSADFDSEYGRYQQAITKALNSTPPEEFQPDLSALDRLIESMEIEGVSAAQDAASMPCVNGLPTRLRIDGFAYVNPEPPLPNNLRREAGKDQPLIGEIPPGEAMKILEGPVCADGWVWWNVRTLEGELSGWTAEGDRQTYWLVPCESRNRCEP